MLQMSVSLGVTVTSSIRYERAGERWVKLSEEQTDGQDQSIEKSSSFHLFSFRLVIISFVLQLWPIHPLVSQIG